MTEKTRGLKRMEDILGPRAEEIRDSFAAISPDFARCIENYAYGELFGRPGLSDKTREVALVSALIARGTTGLPLRTHLQAMRRVGWTKEEIYEVIIFLTGVVGFPNCVEAIVVANDVLKAD